MSNPLMVMSFAYSGIKVWNCLSPNLSKITQYVFKPCIKSVMIFVFKKLPEKKLHIHVHESFINALDLLLWFASYLNL